MQSKRRLRLKFILIDEHLKCLSVNIYIYQTCFGKHDSEYLLVCDHCDQESHTYCLSPQLTQVPVDAWYCPACVAAGIDKEAEAIAKGEKNGSSSGDISGASSDDDEDVEASRGDVKAAAKQAAKARNAKVVSGQEAANSTGKGTDSGTGTVSVSARYVALQ